MAAETSRKTTRGGIGIRCLVTLVVSTCAMVALASPAQALEMGLAPWLVCANSKEAAEVAARTMPIEPANGASVPAGTAVTFSGESNQALTFSVASLSALLSSPDIDSGAGSQSGVFYRFTSTRATATPRTIYWTASFTFTPTDCESPSTFTTSVRTVTVVPSEAELAATKARQEEETETGAHHAIIEETMLVDEIRKKRPRKGWKKKPRPRRSMKKSQPTGA